MCCWVLIKQNGGSDLGQMMAFSYSIMSQKYYLDRVSHVLFNFLNNDAVILYTNI